MDLQATPISPIALENDALLQVIARLQDEPDADFSSKNLATLTGRLATNMSRTLDRMVEGGLIFRDPKPELTSDGREALEALNRARNAELSADGVGEGGVPTGLHAEFDRNPDQPRKKFNPDKLEQLADTIEAVGVLEPILVWPPNDAGLKIIWAGERRWRACGIVNQRHDDPNRVRIPYVTRAPTEEEKAALIAEAAELALIENGQGEDLTSFEKAKALRTMVPSRYPSARAAAKVIGVHEKTAQDWLRALAELPPAVLKRWEDDELGWREVRDILRPAPVKATETDPAQIDIEEVTGGRAEAGSAQPSAGLTLNDKINAGVAQARATAALARAEYFSTAVKEAAISAARTAEGGYPSIVNAKLSGTTTVDGESWPESPSENLSTPWTDYPRAAINLTVSSNGRWFAATSTQAGGPDYSGSGSPPHVYTHDPVFPSRADALAFAAAKIVVRLGVNWGNKRKLKDWLAELTSQVEPIAEAARSAAQTHMDALVNGFSEKLELALLEVEDKASRDPQVLTSIKGKRTEGWAAISEKPVGGALPTLVERGLLEIDHLGDRWFIRVVPGGEGAAWIAEHTFAGEDGRYPRAGRLYQLRTKLLGEHVASQLAAQRLRYAAACLNTARPEDIETAQLLKEARAGTDRKLDEIDRRKADGLSARDVLTVVEVAHALVHANTMPEGFTRGAKVHEYWLDARVGRLKDQRLIGFWNAGGEDGWVVQAGEGLGDWLKAEGYDFETLGKHQLERAQGAGGQAGWPGPGYVTPWLNLPDTAGKSDDDAEDVAGFLVDDEEADEAERTSAQALLGRVVDHIVEPANFGELLRTAGLALPLRVSLIDVGVINDATGAPVLTIDQDRALPDALVAARALLIAAAVNAHDIGRELTDRAPASIVEPEKMTPALMRKSIYPDHLVCLEDGRRFTDLTHHLRVEHDMDWGEYLGRWKLPRDYPSVAPATSEERERTAIDNAHAVLRGTL